MHSSQWQHFRPDGKFKTFFPPNTADDFSTRFPPKIIDINPEVRFNDCAKLTLSPRAIVSFPYKSSRHRRVLGEVQQHLLDYAP